MSDPQGMGWQVVQLDEVAPVPWRNGGGTTRELVAWPHTDEWRVRISVAQIDRDGAFSRFPGAERWFSLIGGDGDGGGVRLVVGGGAQILTRESEAFRFSGNAEVDCTLVGGPAQALNLIALPRTGSMTRARDGLDGVISARSLVAAYAPAGGTVAVYDEQVLDLAPRTLVWRLAEQEGPLALDGEGAVWMEVRL